MQADEGIHSQESPRNGQTSDPSSSNTSSAFASDEEGSRSTKVKMPANLASMRTATMFEAREADHHNRNRPPPEWTVPPKRNGRSIRAATLFLGKDHERWQQHEREAMNGNNAAGLHLAWKRGTASLVNRISTVSVGGEGDEYDEDDTGSSSSYEDDGWLSSSSAGPISRRSSRRSSRGSRGHGWTTRVLQGTPATSKEQSDSAAGSDSGGSIPRNRRFSSNGPEAAFLRHETVIGIHTPRRESLSERLSLAPLSQIKTPPSGASSQVSPAVSAIKRKSKIRQSSSSEVLAQQAAAAAASVGRPSRRNIALTTQSPATLSSADEEDGQSSSVPGVCSPQKKRSASPRLALKLAKRRTPIKVDGTLYDRSGPFREGAVTDGLSVRLFSAEDSTEPTDSHGPTSHDIAVADEEIVPTTYLITTPDNRVSSAAKLRRWAMDGEGRFYAAMEIKSIEAKMRAADPATSGANGQLSKGLLRELRDRYLEDLLDEVQKAETLNPKRMVVSKVLKTSDNKYVRLEEDYPEEAFFVIAGCDESELYPAVALVFCQAVRAIVSFHSAGWLHGDIKLENLMFDQDGNMVVIDYENANPFRGVPGGDGRVTLASYDWIPPEAFPGPHGRRVGPSADLWALGCNMVRAFALRDNVEDHEIRETLLGKGQDAFLAFRKSHLLLSRNPSRRGSGVGLPGSVTRPLPTSEDVDLTCLLDDKDGDNYFNFGSDRLAPVSAAAAAATATTTGEVRAASFSSSPSSLQQMPPPPGPSPKRLLSRFAREAPDLLKLVIARCITELPEERSVEAEIECVRFVETLEAEQQERGEESVLGIGARAVRMAIELSGSAWVRPKLDEARRTLELTA